MAGKEIKKDQTVTVPYGNTEKAMTDAQKEIDKEVNVTTKEVIKEGDTPLTETEAKELARAEVLVEQSGYSTGDIASSTELTKESFAKTPHHPNDVQFDVKYPESYEGDKHMPEGITVVSTETAEHFKSLGIGKIVK